MLPPGMFRLVLAIMVLASHASRLDIGRLAVLLFFFLSGYWVSRIYQSEFDGGRWLTFYLSRWLRIAPLYFIAMLGAALLRGLPIGLDNLWIFGVASTGQDPTGVAWSLDVEMQFYLLLPLLFVTMRSPVLLLIVALGLSAIGWTLKAQYGVATALPYLPVFALGMLNASTRWNPGRKLALVSIAAFGLLTAGALLWKPTAAFLVKGHSLPFDEDLFSMGWMLPLLPYVAGSLSQRSSPFDRDIGNWSYPLYLVHYPLIAFFVAHSYSKWGGVALAPLVALILYYGPDRLFERLRRTLIKVAWRASEPGPRGALTAQAIGDGEPRRRYG